MPDSSPLDLTVLVTRPAQQSEPLSDALAARGAEVIVFPVLEIAARDDALLHAAVAALGDAALTVYVSPNAVRFGLDFASGRIAAIGPSTAAAIEAAGGQVDVVPREGFDSEHLLDEPALQSVAGKRIRIVRGNGGREALARCLAERGALVDYVEVYERRLPVPRPAEVAAIDALWHDGGIDAVVVMSVQSLDNLRQLLPAARRGFASGATLVSPAARVLKEAQQGFPDCPAILARGPGTNDLVDAVASIAQSRRR